MHNTKYQNMPKVYKCKNCGAEVNAPMHCGHAMHIENNEKWVCWMGENCGSQVYSPCCNSTSLQAA